MDLAHVSLVTLQLNSEGFTTFECKKPITLGINLIDFYKILKMAYSDDIITLSASDESSYLEINFFNEGKYKKYLILLIFNIDSEREVEYSLNLLNIQTESLGIPGQDYKTSILMSSSEFAKICKELSVLSEVVNIKVEQDKAKFSIKGKSGNGCIIIKSNNPNKVEDKIKIICQEKINISYGLKYLNSFSKASNVTSLVKIHLSSTNPLLINYEIENFGYIRFYLAPKMAE